MRRIQLFVLLFVLICITVFVVLDKNFLYKTDFSFSNKSDTVLVNFQAFEDVPASVSTQLFEQLKVVYPKIRMKDPISLPEDAYYPPRNRYLADTIIRFLRNNTPKNEKCIGFTTKDISHRNGKITNYGIMGLGFQPGRSCVISSFRLSEKNTKQQLYKLALHEMGHNFGLPHCNNLQCIMRDAKGKNHFDELPAFCESCKKHLTNQGWNL